MMPRIRTPCLQARGGSGGTSVLDVIANPQVAVIALAGGPLFRRYADLGTILTALRRNPGKWPPSLEYRRQSAARRPRNHYVTGIRFHGTGRRIAAVRLAPDISGLLRYFGAHSRATSSPRLKGPGLTGKGTRSTSVAGFFIGKTSQSKENPPQEGVGGLNAQARRILR